MRMLDARFIRENPERVVQSLQHRGYDAGVVNDFLGIEDERRSSLLDVERLRQQRNELSEKISKMKKDGRDISIETQEARKVSEAIKTKEERLKELDEKKKAFLLNMPNIPHESVPVGGGEAENGEIRKGGE